MAPLRTGGLRASLWWPGRPLGLDRWFICWYQL